MVNSVISTRATPTRRYRRNLSSSWFRWLHVITCHSVLLFPDWQRCPSSVHRDIVRCQRNMPRSGKPCLVVQSNLKLLLMKERLHGHVLLSTALCLLSTSSMGMCLLALVSASISCPQGYRFLFECHLCRPCPFSGGHLECRLVAATS